MIKISNVSKSFNNKLVLDDVSMEFPDAGVVCLFGKTGAGKTTLLNLIAGIDKPDIGKITGTEGKSISYVFQDNRLLPWFSVKKNLSISNHLGEEYLNKLLEDFDLEHARNLNVLKLSGGMKRKADIAKAILFDGDVFILDEPFTGIDDNSKEKIIQMLMELSAEKLIILVTHNIEEAKRMTDTIIYM